MSSTRLLLLSNSRSADGAYLEHARGPLRDLLDGQAPTVLFVPYAGVTVSADAYASRVREALAPIGCALVSLHACADPARAVAEAGAIAVGGGNTFALLQRLYAAELLGALRERVMHGVPYIGWSAGSVVA
ncbi:MAG: Type 1 glutamine amidotransferase-like domain-containing protein, partial [Gemmatimonadaceae bacterium]